VTPKNPEKTRTNGGGFAAPELEQSVSTFSHRVRRFLRQRNSRVLDCLLIFCLGAHYRLTKKKLPAGLRALASSGFSLNPLAQTKHPPAINVCIPFVEKDIEVLPHVVRSVHQYVENPIKKIFLVTPADGSSNTPLLTEEVSIGILTELLAGQDDLELLFDHQVLGEKAWEQIRSAKPGGWVIQQLVKFASVLRDPSTPTLILDSDTVLLSPKTWVDGNNVQLLQVANEFEPRYFPFMEKFFSIQKRLNVSFVTHHQLMQPSIVAAMFPQGQQSIVSWWTGSQEFPGAFLSEYESYGSYALQNYPNQVRLGSWSNLLSPKFNEFRKVTSGNKNIFYGDLVPHYCSISFHAHAQSHS
jgi:hypothetical protein